MLFFSTRDHSYSISSAHAIEMGIAPGGGLFVPAAFPRPDLSFVLSESPYPHIAAEILGLYLSDFPKDQLLRVTERSYGAQFMPAPAVLRKVIRNLFSLELWHGPTLAFKDIALQCMPRLFRLAKEQTQSDRDTLILVATSGDTGKAALEGFRDVEGFQIFVLYPRHGVSDIQRLQMTTQEGANLFVAGVDGNFDDAQRTIKALLSDSALQEELSKRGCSASSANSINIARLLPQIVYYFTAYRDLIRRGEIEAGNPVDFVVPSGNFGNILAGYYAKRMGLPVGRLIAASNRNDVLCEFLRSGHYRAQRPFYVTISPSMDILIASNVERLVFEMTGRDDHRTNTLYQDLKEDGAFSLSAEETREMRDTFSSYAADEDQTRSMIRSIFDSAGYLVDPHTAVAFSAAEQYRNHEGGSAPVVVLSTASPYKFADSVLFALSGEERSGFAALEALQKFSGTDIPSQLAELAYKEVRFDNCIEARDAKQVLTSFLNREE